MLKPPLRLLRRLPAGLLLFLISFLVGLLVTYLIYGAILPGYYISDDFVWLDVANRSLESSVHLLDRDVGNFYRPVAHLFNLLVLAGWGPHPVALHWGALLLHTLNLALLVALAHALTRQRWLALCAGLIFAVLPLYQEAVVWISATNEVLYGLWALCCLLAWQHHLRRASRASLAASLAALAMAMGTKEVALSLPGLMVLVHVWLRSQGRIGKIPLTRYLPVAGLSLLFCLVQLQVYGQSGLVATHQYLLEPAALLRLAHMAGNAIEPLWILLPALAAGLIMTRRPRRQGQTMRTAALILTAALALVLIPYAPLTWGPAASRFYYAPCLLVSLAGAAVLALAGGSGRIPAQLLALTGLASLALLNVWRTDEPIRLYLETSARSRRYIARAVKLPAPTIPLRILDCPLPGQHMSSAMAVFHHSRSRNFYCISRQELLRLTGPRWVWRWLPKFEKFAVIERRTNR